MNAIVTHSSAGTFGSGMIPKDMDQAMRLATAMANAKMVPAHLQNDVGSCLMIVDQAMRWNISPFAVAQCTSSIRGKLMYEGKLLAGVAVSTGAIIGDFDYAYAGDPTKPDTLSVTATATRASDQKPQQMTQAWKDVKTTNEYWTKQPEQQLAYSVVRAWVRRYTPSVLLGVYAPEEFDRGAVPVDTFDGTTIDAKPEPAAETAAEPKRQTIAEWLTALEAELQAAETAEAVDGIAFRQDVQKALDGFRNGALERLKGIIDAAQRRTAPPVAIDPIARLLATLDALTTDAAIIAWRVSPETKAAIGKLSDAEREQLEYAVSERRRSLNDPGTAA